MSTAVFGFEDEFGYDDFPVMSRYPPDEMSEWWFFVRGEADLDWPCPACDSALELTVLPVDGSPELAGVLWALCTGCNSAPLFSPGDTRTAPQRC